MKPKDIADGIERGFFWAAVIVGVFFTSVLGLMLAHYAKLI